MPLSEMMKKTMDKRDAKVLLAIRDSRDSFCDFRALLSKTKLKPNALRRSLWRLRFRRRVLTCGVARNTIYQFNDDG